MLSRCCCHASLSLSFLSPAKSIPSHSTRDSDEAFRRGIPFGANLRPLRRGALCGGSSHDSQWCCATSARPPPPNFGADDSDSSGYISRFQEEFSKIQDKVRIFFAVLFWMLLFFWASAWDGTDDSRNKKGPRFGNKLK